jgi:general secretion pathway protein G
MTVAPYSPSYARTGFSLTELMAVVAVVGVIALIAVPRLTAGSTESKAAACAAYRGNIEIQAELWRHNTGDWPAANLSDVGADPLHFPEGLPTCPVDGIPFTINAAGRVVGHSH